MYEFNKVYYFDDFFARIGPPAGVGTNSSIYPLSNSRLFEDEPFQKYLNSVAELYDSDDSLKERDSYYWECIKAHDEAFLRLHYFIMSNAGKLLYVPSGVFFEPIPTEQFFYDICETNLMTFDEAFNFCLENPTLSYFFYCFATSIYPNYSNSSSSIPLPVYLCSWKCFPFECCYPDFSPIVRILGGTPSLVQLENLKSICYLLGVYTAENGLKDCDLMKEYLKRLNQILGGSPYSEPNDNLKSNCYLLGVDNSENGLKDCDLSKDYVKRISKMLGAE